MVQYPHKIEPKKRSEFLPSVIVGSQGRNELASVPLESRSANWNKRRRA